MGITDWGHYTQETDTQVESVFPRITSTRKCPRWTPEMPTQEVQCPRRRSGTHARNSTKSLQRGHATNLKYTWLCLGRVVPKCSLRVMPSLDGSYSSAHARVPKERLILPGCRLLRVMPTIRNAHAGGP